MVYDTVMGDCPTEPRLHGRGSSQTKVRVASLARAQERPSERPASRGLTAPYFHHPTQSTRPQIRCESHPKPTRASKPFRPRRAPSATLGKMLPGLHRPSFQLVL